MRMRDATTLNRKAWNAQRYDAWVAAYGSPEDQAGRIIANPNHVLRRLIPYLGEIRDKRICNVQGSHGRVAVALARLGAQVQVIDFAEENRRYALNLAAAAGVSIDYAVCDVMEAGNLGLHGRFDMLVLELGILHYHQDLDTFFAVMHGLTAKGGQLLLNEFHPVQRKLFWPDGPHDYFQSGLVTAHVPNPDPGGVPLGHCHYRFWTMAEVITAIINAGFTIRRMDEHPEHDEPTIPGSFTLLADV